MKKNSIKKIIETVFFLIILTMVLFVFSNIVEYKNSRANKMPLYNIDTDVDVFFAGASHAHDGLYPETFWRKHGITSYNISSGGEAMETTYYVIKELIKVKKPKVIVVDMYLAKAREHAFNQNQGLIHESIDFMPMGDSKFKIAKGVSESQDLSMAAILSNVYAYHNRWKELEKRDFSEEWNGEKGAESMARIDSQVNPNTKSDITDENALKGTGYEYMKKIVDLCTSKDIKCVFVNLPFASSDSDRQAYENSCLSEIEKDGAYVINFNGNIDEIGIDFERDFFDDGHFNVVGANKMSNYMAKYLIKEFNLEDHRCDSSYSSWNDRSEFINWRLSKTKKAEDANEALLYLADIEEIDKKVIYSNNIEKYCLEKLQTAAEIMPINMSMEGEMSDEEISEIMSELGLEKVNKNQAILILSDKDTGDLIYKTILEIK